MASSLINWLRISGEKYSVTSGTSFEHNNLMLAENSWRPKLIFSLSIEWRENRSVLSWSCDDAWMWSIIIGHWHDSNNSLSFGRRIKLNLEMSLFLFCHFSQFFCQFLD